METEILPGSIIELFDPNEYIDDLITPNCLRKAIVVRRYGYKFESRFNIFYDDYGNQYGEPEFWNYPDCIDVVFIHRPNKISKGHFTPNT